MAEQWSKERAQEERLRVNAANQAAQDAFGKVAGEAAAKAAATDAYEKALKPKK